MIPQIYALNYFFLSFPSSTESLNRKLSDLRKIWKTKLKTEPLRKRRRTSVNLVLKKKENLKFLWLIKLNKLFQKKSKLFNFI